MSYASLVQYGQFLSIAHSPDTALSCTSSAQGKVDEAIRVLKEHGAIPEGLRVA